MSSHTKSVSPLETPNHLGPPEGMPDTSRFLTDGEYRLIQNNIVISCTDVLIIDQETGEALSGFRQQKPQEGYWFSCGGRMKRGQSYQDAGASKVKDELGLEIDPSRLEFLTAYSTAFIERAQEPSEEGVHTSNAVVVLFISPEERERMNPKFNEEHAKADWVPLEQIIQDDEFPPILTDAMIKVDRALYANFAKEALRQFYGSYKKPEELIYETEGFPESNFTVPADHIFFKVVTKGMQAYTDTPESTYISSTPAGEEVKVPNNESTAHTYTHLEGVLLGPNETKEVTTYILGIPVTTVLKNQNGIAEVLEARELPLELIEASKPVQRTFASGRYTPEHNEALERYRLEQEIQRELRKHHDYSAERQPTQISSKLTHKSTS